MLEIHFVFIFLRFTSNYTYSECAFYVEQGMCRVICERFFQNFQSSLYPGDKVLIWFTVDSVTDGSRTVARRTLPRGHIPNGQKPDGYFSSRTVARAYVSPTRYTQIQNLTNLVNPQSVMVDFEQTMIGYLDCVYPVVPQKGYLFHLLKTFIKVHHSFI